MNKASHFAQKKGISNKTRSAKKRRLYTALLKIHSFSKVEDLLLLKSKSFLDLLEVDDLSWNFNTSWLRKDLFQFPQNEKSWPFQIDCPLNATSHYGSLLFYSSKKFSQSQKKFLKKIAGFIAGSLDFIESKVKKEHLKQEWSQAFDSFPQAFCITDKNFKILRANQSFKKISKKSKQYLPVQKLFELFPFPAKMPSPEEEGSWLTKGVSDNDPSLWEISFKPIFLKQESFPALLFLIKNVTEEMAMEARLSAQANERELGLIKGSLAHELNNPIAGIKALLFAIERQIPNQLSLEKSHIKDLQKAINRCENIVQKLLMAGKKPQEKSKESL